ncbi:single-stranded-DNA-specific exonuclease RecJ [Acinetobacter sp. CUI P1]|nr:single-stranded-DNA-specific exonuclease RecJ [Acinetobacter sp. CUI P1]
MQWQLQDSNQFAPGMVQYYARQFLLPPFLTKALLTAGITNEDLYHTYAYPNLSDLHNPYFFKDMKKAVYRIYQAIVLGQRICIFGDYDADGMTSSALLYRALCFLKGDVSVRVPTRTEGYGLTPEAVERMAEENPALIITVDNGSNSHEALAAAVAKGIDVIVTDHHEITGELPRCYAFINPKRNDDTYPCTHLCGAGVAFKVVQALFAVRKDLDWHKYAWEYLELVALGTVADLMPLVGENRTLVKLGLYKMNNVPSEPFNKLFQLLRLTHIDSSTISFLIAPIFNSVGRIGNPNFAVKLLTEIVSREDAIISMIDLNEKRKYLTEVQFGQVDETIQRLRLFNQDLIVVADELHEGLIGILAAKITEKYQKPAIVFTERGKGSARSVSNTSFSIVDAIQNCSQYLKTFGGHHAAAGLSLEIDQLDSFTAAIQIAARKQSIIQPSKMFHHELPIQKFEDEFFEHHFMMEPFGIGNEKPLYYSSAIPSHYRVECFGKEQVHASLVFNKKRALAFYKASSFPNAQSIPFEFLYTINSYGRKDFIINDLRG